MKFIKQITQSGIPLYILPMPAAQTVAAGVLVNVGSRDEIMPQEAGIAHGFEHLFFQGTKKFPDKKALSEYMEEVGGYFNASTGKELTFFHNQVPHQEFERGIVCLSEQIQYSLIPEEKVRVEMNVVIQELKRAEDTPMKFLYTETFKILYKNHPLGHSTLGTETNLLSFQRKNFIDFMNRYYHPANYIFTVAGRADPAKAIKLLDQYFVKTVNQSGNLRSPQNLSEKPPASVILKKKINQVHTCLAAPILLATNQEKIQLDLFSAMIGVGKASPLVEEIRNKRGLCYSVFAQYNQGTDGGLFSIYMATNQEKYQEGIKIAFSILESYKNNRERLEKVKKMTIGRLALEFENPLNIIQNAAYDIVSRGKPYGYEEVSEAIKDVTIADIEGVVIKYLKRGNFTTVLLAPEEMKI